MSLEKSIVPNTVSPLYVDYINNGGFTEFERDFTTYIEKKGLGTLLNGKETCPTVPELTIENQALYYTIFNSQTNWVRRDNQLLGEIKFALGNDYNRIAIMDESETDQSACAAWKKVKAEYDKKDNGFLLTSLLLEFPGLKLEKDVTAFSNRIIRMSKQIETMGVKLPDMLLTAVFLNGLPRQYQEFSLDYKRKSALPVLSTIIGQFGNFEKELIRTNQLKPEIGKAFSAKTHGKHEKYCSVHKSDSHNEDQCYTLHPELKGKKRNDSKQDDKKTYKALEAKIEKLMEMQEKWSERANIARPQSSDEITLNHYTDFGSWPRANVAKAMVVKEQMNEVRLYVDSGASKHMVNDLQLLCDYQELKDPIGITVGNNETIPAIGYGKLQLYSGGRKITVGSVLYVPKISDNLLSVDGFLEQGLHAEFTKNNLDGKCLNLLNKENEVVLKGKAIHGMFQLVDTNVQREQSLVAQLTKDSEELGFRRHQQLGHMSGTYMDKAVGEIGGLDKPKISFSANSLIKNCDICNRGKAKQLKFEVSNPDHHPQKLGDILYSDLAGPFPAKTRQGYLYYILFLDGKSRYLTTYLLSNKSQAFAVYKEYTAWYFRQTGTNHKVFRTDNGGEFTSVEFERYLSEMGTKHETSIARTPQQGGNWERWNYTIGDKLRCLLIESGLPASFWGELVLTCTYLINRSPTAFLNGKTPYEELFGHKPQIDNLKVIGCTAYALNTDPKRKKLDERGLRCVLIGYLTHQKGWRLYHPDTKSFIHSRSVVFNEEEICYPKWTDIPDEVPAGILTTDKNAAQPIDFHCPSPPDCIIPIEEENYWTALDVPSAKEDEDADLYHDANIHPDVHVNSRLLNELTQTQGFNLHGPPAETKRVPVQRALMVQEDWPQNWHFVRALNARIQEIMVPKSQHEAHTSLERNHWLDAEAEEKRSLIENNVFGNWITLPPGKKAINTMFVYDVKRTTDGGIDRYKARLVAKGTAQKFGIDFNETFAPTAKLCSARIVLVHALQSSRHIRQLDVKTAFLYSDLEEELYVKLPAGFDGDQGNGLVKRCQKSLYGLKQSPRNWNKLLDTILKENGFKRSSADHSVYVKDYTCGETVILVVYVDDILISSRKDLYADEVSKLLKEKFKIKEIQSNRFVGIEYNYNRGALEIHQRAYIDEILEKFAEFVPDRLSPSPLSDSEKLSTEDCPRNSNDINSMKDKPYSSLLGSLMFLMLGSRPDLAHSMSVLARFMDSPGVKHWNGLRRVLGYVKKTRDLSLVYTKQGEPVFAYSDSDFAACTDTRRSISGYCFIWQNAAISWKSQKQSTVATSSCHAEYIALFEAAREAIWIQAFMKSIGILTTTTQILEDNNGALLSANNPVFHSRMKHIDVKYHALREWVENGIVKVIRCGTEKMVADSLTKAVPVPKSRFCASGFGLQ